MIRLVALLAAAGLLLAGCGLVEAPPDRSPEALAPAVLPDSRDAQEFADLRLPALSRDGFQRRAAAVTVRVRNLTCAGLGTGSGFAIDSSTLITNRHVVAGADLLEVNTADGRTFDVTAAEVGVLGDIAFVTVDGVLPVTADLSGRAEPGAEVAAVGYPQGGPFTVSRGVVIDRVDGTPFGVDGPILRVRAEVQPGNSGGPLLDRRGRVAGVVYAIEIATGLALAIPMDTVDALLERAGTTAVPPCGSP
ncbi:MAG: trypsin-like peptidase domain-containing protein [Thermoleophilia bacterium]|nr:trypsin-like peptidase domain-containing protein [Thermoleophilia bacterium]